MGLCKGQSTTPPVQNCHKQLGTNSVIVTPAPGPAPQVAASPGSPRLGPHQGKARPRSLGWEGQLEEQGPGLKVSLKSTAETNSPAHQDLLKTAHSV